MHAKKLCHEKFQMQRYKPVKQGDMYGNWLRGFFCPLIEIIEINFAQ